MADASYPYQSVIFGFGNSSLNGNFQLYQESVALSNLIKFYYVNGADSVVGIAPSYMQHVVISLSQKQGGCLNGLLRNVYVDGVSQVQSCSPQLLKWVPAALSLAAADVLPAWGGYIFLLSIYNRSLSQSEVQTNYDAFVANSLPVTRSVAFTGVENTTLYFNLSAQIFDFDAHMPPFSATPPLCAAYQTVFFSLLAPLPPPSVGTFCLVLGSSCTPIDASNLLESTQTIAFVPARFVFSVPPSLVTSVQFRAQDSQGAISRTSAVISISLTGVNDPPVAVGHILSAFNNVSRPCEALFYCVYMCVTVRECV
jgi:hypothetical protein